MSRGGGLVAPTGSPNSLQTFIGSFSTVSVYIVTLFGLEKSMQLVFVSKSSQLKTIDHI